MGGAAAEPQGKGGKKALDAHINLVPYIDLLMTIMTFLVMTAVWTQIAALEVQNASGGNPPEEKEEKEEDPPKPIIVLVTANSLKIQEEGGEPKEFPNTADGYDLKSTKTELKRLKDARPDRSEVRVQAEDGVSFEPIVQVIDVATGICVDPKDKSTCLAGLTLTPATGS